MSPPSKPAITARRSTASNSNSVALHSVCIGAILDSEKTVLAQHFSQILSPDAPLSFEKSRLGRVLMNQAKRVSVRRSFTGTIRSLQWDRRLLLKCRSCSSDVVRTQ